MAGTARDRFVTFSLTRPRNATTIMARCTVNCLGSSIMSSTTELASHV